MTRCMQKKQRNHYNEEFKRKAVKILIDSGKPVTTIAGELGVEQSILHKWNKRYRHEIDYPPSDNPDNHGNELNSLRKEIIEIKATLETLRTIILKSLGDKYL